MELCDLKCVVLQTNRAKCTLNKDILDLLMRKAFLEHVEVEPVYKFDEKSTASEKVSQMLGGHNIYIIYKWTPAPIS